MSENYEFIDIIGSGMYGRVYKALNKLENKYYAIKRLNFKDISEKEKKSINKEISMLKDLNHPNVLSYKDSFIDQDNYYNIVTAFCGGGDISQIIEKHKEKNEFFTEEKILNWLIQLLLGLSYIHSKGIIHRDIKPQNIFIQNKYLICIGDFGIAKNINQTQTQTIGTSIIGTPLYMSPESYNNPKYNKFPSDIWSMGCCLFELCNLDHAFGGDSLNAVFNKVREGKRPPINKKYSSELKYIVDSMLDIKPSKRPTITQLIESNNFLRQKVAKFIDDFINNYKKYDSTEEYAKILKNQADDFKLFKNNINKEIKENKEALNEKNKKIMHKNEEFNIKKINQIKNNNANKRDFSNPTSKGKDNHSKKYSTDKNNKNINKNAKNNFSVNNKRNNNEDMNNHKNNQKIKDDISPLNNNQRNMRKNNLSNKKKKTSNRPFSMKNIEKNNIAIVKEKDKIDNLKEINKNNNKYIKEENDSALDNLKLQKNIKMNSYNNLININDNSENNKEKILKEKINYFMNKCIDSLGKRIFNDAYNYLFRIKKNKNENINNRDIREHLIKMFGKDNIAYWHLIEQILILEDILNDK